MLFSLLGCPLRNHQGRCNLTLKKEKIRVLCLGLDCLDDRLRGVSQHLRIGRHCVFWELSFSFLVHQFARMVLFVIFLEKTLTTFFPFSGCFIKGDEWGFFLFSFTFSWLANFWECWELPFYLRLEKDFLWVDCISVCLWSYFWFDIDSSYQFLWKVELTFLRWLEYLFIF